jgi:hypothetical protein
MQSLMLTFFLSAFLPGSPQALPETLAAVSRNVKQVQESLPDIVCNEKVTSTSFRSGNQRDQKIVESLFSIRNWREQREILAIDGKPAKKGAKMPNLTMNVRGVFNTFIMATFLPELIPLHDFNLKQPGAPDGRLVVDFETRKDQKKIIWDIDGKNLVAHDTGQASIDPTSMQVARLERSLLNLSRDFSSYKVTIDQAPVNLGDRLYWLPKTFFFEIIERDVRNRKSYLAEYSNCKKFTTEITIRVQ